MNSRLTEELKTSEITRRTIIYIKKLVFTIVQKALLEHYGQNYSTYCLQSSVAVQKLLKGFGIESQLNEGAACFLEVGGKNPYTFAWGGFWDKDHHVWVTTTTGELIDFTISQLHMHPAAIANNYCEIPPIWWSPIDISPFNFRYLPTRYSIVPNLEKKDETDLNCFLDKVEIVKNELLNEEKINLFSTFILEGLDSLTFLFEIKNHWAMGSYIADRQNFDFPEWICKREAELLKHYK